MEKGFVYLINDWEQDNVYKIGVTRGSIERRIKKLQTGNPDELITCRYYHTEHPFFVEKQLHKKYLDCKVRDEWFKLTDNDVFNFEKTCKEIENIISIMKDNPFFPKKVK